MLESQAQGNYRFIPGDRGRVPFCNGVLADQGYEIVRATLDRPIPYQKGFELIERHLSALGRPRQALCGVELRAKEPYTRESFNAFNAIYAELLGRWGLYADGIGTAARTNIAPTLAAPAEQVLYAFSYTVPSQATEPTFVLSGAAAVGVREGDTSAEGVRAKIAHLASIIEGRLREMGLSWESTTEIVVYAAQDIEGALRAEVLPRIGSAALNGIRWFPGRAPVVDTEVELGAHGVRQEIRIPAR